MALRRDVMKDALDHLTELRVTSTMISYVAQKVPNRLGPIPHHSFHNSDSTIPSVLTFAELVVTNFGVPMALLMASLVYLLRLRHCGTRCQVSVRIFTKVM
jgi:hypothetical protein